MESWPCVVAGGGAAGYFAVAELMRRLPGVPVLHLEKSGKALSKVRISGGGRCNLTHNCPDPAWLLKNYPRGNPWLAPVFARFAVAETLAWFRERGLETHAEADGRMFPLSNSSESVIAVLEKAAKGKALERRFGCGLSRILPLENGGFRLDLTQGEPVFTRNLILATGGSPSPEGNAYLRELGLPMVPPVPSLFTFNLKPHPWKSLMGVSMTRVKVALPDAGLEATGPFLITHWGLSGPAVLRLSAFGARWLKEKNYKYRVTLSLLPDHPLPEIRRLLLALQENFSRKKPVHTPLPEIPSRLWELLCTEAGLDRVFNWAEAGKKQRDALAGLLFGRSFTAEGKTTFKEEFVTAGGLALDAVDAGTCGVRAWPGLFAAGEFLDADGVTGGFNFQAAWSTAYVAAASVAERIGKG